MAVKLAFHVEGTGCSRTPTLSIGASTLYETLLSCGWYAIGHPDFTPPKTPPISASRKALQAPDGNATHGPNRLESLEEPFFSIRKGFSDCSENPACGEYEIRTREAVTPTRFPSVRHRPLGEFSNYATLSGVYPLSAT